MEPIKLSVPSFLLGRRILPPIFSFPNEENEKEILVFFFPKRKEKERKILSCKTFQMRGMESKREEKNFIIKSWYILE